jgi:hypothetical protein
MRILIALAVAAVAVALFSTIGLILFRPLMAVEGFAVGYFGSIIVISLGFSYFAAGAIMTQWKKPD